MTRTIVASRGHEVAIGADQPFRVIGERINPTGRRALSSDLLAGGFARTVAEARAQARAGADILDVNTGVTSSDPGRSEPALLAGALKAVQSAIDVPLAIDSGSPEALEAGLSACASRPLLNSVNGTEASLSRLIPLARNRDVPIVALCHDGTAAPPDPGLRFEIARRIVERAADHGIARHDVIVDPLVLPLGAGEPEHGGVLALIGRLRTELGVNTICGLSNVSFGKPNRARLNADFLKAAIAHGLTAAIMNPLSPPEMAVARSLPRPQGSAFPSGGQTG